MDTLRCDTCPFTVNDPEFFDNDPDEMTRAHEWYAPTPSEDWGDTHILWPTTPKVPA